MTSPRPSCTCGRGATLLGNLTRFLTGSLLLLATPAAVLAQGGPASVCTEEERRQFDFWIGIWTVTDTTGRELGMNEISPTANGCGLHEDWRGIRGGEGMSLSVWQPLSGEWTQFWVGAFSVLHLTGGLDSEGRMVLAGKRQTPDGTLRDRIMWWPHGDGTVRQQWDVSRDDGVSWERFFEGIYRRRDATSPEEVRERID